MCEEVLIDKAQTADRIKALSTGDKVQLELKGRDAFEIDLFAKFILASNEEEYFIKAGKHDIRYWIRKIPMPKTDNVRMMYQLVEEIPAFLHYLNNRKLSTNNESRMWFHKDLLVTDALIKLREANRPQAEKIIVQKIKDLFIDTGEKQLTLPFSYIMDKFLTSRKENESYIRNTILKENLKVDRYKNEKGKYCTCYFFEPHIDLDGKCNMLRRHGRPYIFERDNFLTAEDFEMFEIAEQTAPVVMPEENENFAFCRADIFG
jgi:hypothetical protein